MRTHRHCELFLTKNAHCSLAVEFKSALGAMRQDVYHAPQKGNPCPLGCGFSFCCEGNWFLEPIPNFSVLRSKMRLLKPQENILGARRACVLESSSPLTRTKTKMAPGRVPFLFWCSMRTRRHCAMFFAKGTRSPPARWSSSPHLVPRAKVFTAHRKNKAPLFAVPYFFMIRFAQSTKKLTTVSAMQSRMGGSQSASKMV